MQFMINKKEKLLLYSEEIEDEFWEYFVPQLNTETGVSQKISTKMRTLHAICRNGTE